MALKRPCAALPLYRHLTEIMPRFGISVFLYDRRGFGASTSGGAAAGNFDLLAGDTIAAFARLRRGRDVDPTRIGFWGLSQVSLRDDCAMVMSARDRDSFSMQKLS